MSVRPIWTRPAGVGGALLLSPRNALVGRSCYSTARAAEHAITPLTSVLIANRGEIALRVGRTASEWGIRTTTIYTEPDARSQHALSSPFAVGMGEPSAYLDGDRIIEIAKREGCQSIHPGYGFLSENSAFARKCSEAGLTFIGPPWKAIEAMGSKSESKNIMTAAGVPCIPGYHGLDQDPAVLRAEAAKIGYPVLLKAIKGGGGKGMRIVRGPAEFDEQLTSARSEARNSFGDDRMLVEKYITRPRHIEVQVFADKHGNCVALGERDCSVQRRHQKILEESPAPRLAPERRRELWAKARAAAVAVGYEGAGTVEFIFDNDTRDFFFMEMNTRLQVEHPVTEMVTGQDLVRWQLLVAEGHALPLTQEQVEARIAERGWAFEARIYAENPDMNFMPDSGRLVHLQRPKSTETVRIDAGFVQGDEISSHYDPMIAKLIVRGPTREAALQKLRAALEDYEIVGPKTNIDFLKRVCANADFAAGEVETGFIEKHRAELFAAEAVPDELFAQAAMYILMRDVAAVAAAARQQTHFPFFNSLQTSPFPSAAAAAAATTTPASVIGLGPANLLERELSFANITTTGAFSLDDDDDRSKKATVPVLIRQKSMDTFDITVNGRSQFVNVTSHFDEVSKTLRSFYPGHTRLDTRIVVIDNDNNSNNNNDRTQEPPIVASKMHLFQRGAHHVLELAPPRWLHKALSRAAVAPRSLGGEHSFSSIDRATTGSASSSSSSSSRGGGGGDGTRSSSSGDEEEEEEEEKGKGEEKGRRPMRKKKIPSPMPCKILRVHVSEGDTVSKDQALVVIESMKMETVIRSPGDGLVVGRVLVKGGDLCRAGAAMLELSAE